MCEFYGDCFIDTCASVASAVYCTPESCKPDANCSNAPKPRNTLKLFDTGCVGIGVLTSTDLDVGDIVREYASVLCAYEGQRTCQPAQTLKRNRGYIIRGRRRNASRTWHYSFDKVLNPAIAGGS